jgi:hypothetical protein
MTPYQWRQHKVAANEESIAATLRSPLMTFVFFILIFFLFSLATTLKSPLLTHHQQQHHNVAAQGRIYVGAPLVKKKKLNIFAGKFCIIVNLRFGETEEGDERLESEFF